MKLTGNEPAYPVIEADYVTNQKPGLTIRLHLAAMAMQGVIRSMEPDEPIQLSQIAKWSVEMSDALIAAYNEREDK